MEKQEYGRDDSTCLRLRNMRIRSRSRDFPLLCASRSRIRRIGIRGYPDIARWFKFVWKNYSELVPGEIELPRASSAGIPAAAR